MALILTLIRPVYIVDINWIGKLQGLYFVWCRNNRPSRFIVIQHGLYVGGMITDNAHKYVKCDMILCWGYHSFQEFKKYNSRKNVDIVLWGNPLFNQYARDEFSYKASIDNKVLVVPTVVKGSRKEILFDFMRRLEDLGFEIYIKEHAYQGRLSTSFAGFRKVEGSLAEILFRHEYDIIVSDTSTSLVDSIYFKNNTLFFSPPGELPEYTRNEYANCMQNLYYSYHSFSSKEDVLGCIDLVAQEKLLDNMVHRGTNNLSVLSDLKVHSDQ